MRRTLHDLSYSRPASALRQAMSPSRPLLLATELTSTVPFTPQGGNNQMGDDGLAEAARAGLFP